MPRSEQNAPGWSGSCSRKTCWSVAAGAGAGLIAASWILAGVSALLRDVLPLGRIAEVDARVVAATAGMLVVCTAAFGLLPALHGTSAELRSALGHEGRGGMPAGRRGAAALVAVQVMLATVLLVGAALLGGSFARLASVDSGFDSQGVLAIPISLSGPRYPDDARAAFLETAIGRLTALPGVESAAATATNPFRQWGFVNDVTPEDRAAGAPASGLLQAGWRSVTPGYFETLHVTLIEGRRFAFADRDGAPRVALISQDLATRMWPGQSAIGKRFFWGGTSGRTRTVVGVVADIRDVRLDAPAMPMASPVRAASTRGHDAARPDAAAGGRRARCDPP